jgi:hypothetical protein
VQHKDKCRTGHFWVLVAPRRHVLFEYTPEHSSERIPRKLMGTSRRRPAPSSGDTLHCSRSPRSGYSLACPMTLANDWPHDAGENGSATPAGGPMTLAVSWPHEVGENASR